jgi:tRNA pseudouridine13 synthase
VILKRSPDDFQVEELSALAPGGGPFGLYRLTKRGLGTPEAVAAVLKRWHLPRQRLAYGGLKDRHALTQQMLTIYHGPQRGLKQTNLELAYLGQVDRPITSADIAANRFRIVLRDLSADDAARARGALAAIGRDGLPNYFDEQRFGSRGRSGEFIARAWCLRDYERAIWLALADAHDHDRPRQRAERQHLRAHWGNWEACRSGVEFPPAPQIVAYLAEHPDDFRGAIRLLRSDLRWLYISAFQSFLWNRMLTAWLRQQCRQEQLFQMPIDGDPVAFYWSLDGNQRQALAELELPLPSARQRLDEGPVRANVEGVLADLGLTLRDLKIDYPRDSFFSKGERAAIYRPAGLAHQLAPDDLYPGRHKLSLHFDLPRGCYATILIRRLETEGQRH